MELQFINTKQLRNAKYQLIDEDQFLKSQIAILRCEISIPHHEKKNNFATKGYLILELLKGYFTLELLS